MNVSFQHFYGHVKKAALMNWEEGENEYIPCIVFGAASVPGRAMGFHVLTEEGGVYWRVPIHALSHNPEQSAGCQLDLPALQTWDCFGYDMSVTVFDYIDGLSCTAKCGNLILPGEYMMTFDWRDNGFSDDPEQNKCAHLLRLDCGLFALKPNNQIRWADLSFTVSGKEPCYRTNTKLWRCELPEKTPTATTGSEG